MKHYFLLVIVLLFLSNPCIAQLFDDETVKAITAMKKQLPYTGERYSPGKSMAVPCNIAKSKTIDTCRLEITYTAEIALDSLSSKRTNDLVVVQVGDSILKYFSWVWWRYNMNRTLFDADREKEQVSVDESYKPAVDYDVFRDMKQAKLVNCHMLPRLKDYIYEYDEPLPQFKWEISADTLTIAGYLCYKAETKHAGRYWTVWFTPEIPVDGGLWKFNGLPGLILKASDRQNHFVFTLRSINRNAAPIIYYEIRKKKVTREEYRAFELKKFRKPFLGPANGLMVLNKTTNQMEFIPDDWEIPYNPIELE